MKHQLSRAALPLAQRFDETEKKIDAIQHQLDNLYGNSPPDAQDQ